MPLDVPVSHEERRLSFSGACEADKISLRKAKPHRCPAPMGGVGRRQVLGNNRKIEGKASVMIEVNDENAVTISREMLLNPCPRSKKPKSPPNQEDTDSPAHNPTTNDTPVASAIASRLDRQIIYLERQLAESNHRTKVFPLYEA